MKLLVRGETERCKNKSCFKFFHIFKNWHIYIRLGYAMIPLIQRETVEKKKWITDGAVRSKINMSQLCSIFKKTAGHRQKIFLRIKP